MWIIFCTLLLIDPFDVLLAKSNVDWLFPSAGARIYTTSERGTYFGYSVASYVGQNRPFCLVGAPKARNNLDFLEPEPSQQTAGPLEQMFGKSTGLVYRLDLDPTYPDCSVMPIADNNENRRQHGTLEPGVSLWIGGLVTATSNGRDGLQLGCDPRYLYTPSASNKSLPGIGMQNMGTGTCALYTGVSMQYTSIDACVSMEEGTCLSGFSGAIESGQESGEAFTVLGMPGSYLTEGNVFFGHYQGLQTLQSVRLKSSPQDLKHKGYNLGYAVGLYKHPQWIPKTPSKFTILASSPMWIENDYRGIVMVLTEALNIDSIDYVKDQWGHIGSFFGYSVALADLDGNGLPEIIVGAPYFTENRRFKETQQRSVATPTPGVQSDEEVKNESSDSEKPDSRYRSIIPDIGRTYIFYGRRKNVSLEEEEYMDQVDPTHAEYASEPPVILTGLKQVGGRFGHAIVSLDDVDGDGIEDLAVSCPFCPDKDGRPDIGAVFIYLGRKNEHLADNPDQIVYPADLPESTSFSCEDSFDAENLKKKPFKAFGWSLASRSDVDGNMSPDLIVGDVDSEQVVTFRSRSILWMDHPEWSLPKRPTLDWSGPQKSPCGSRCRYNISLTLQIQGREEFFSNNKSLRFRVHLDLDSRIADSYAKRIETESTEEALLINEVIVPLNSFVKPTDGSRGIQILKLFDMVVEPRLRQTIDQLWKPVVINATVELLPDQMPFLVKNGKPTDAWTLHPSRGQRFFTSKPLFFSNPACGHDDICIPELEIEVYDTSHMIDMTESSTIYYRERVSERNLTVAVRNSGENAYNAKLRVMIPAQFGYIPDKNLACKIEEEMETGSNVSVMTTVVCSLANPFMFASSRWEKWVFQLSTSGVFQAPETTRPKAGSKEFHSVTEDEEEKAPWQPPKSLKITAMVTSDNENMDNKEINANFSYDLKLFADVELSSSSGDHTVIDRRNFSSQFSERQRVHPESLGPEFEHIFLVSNNGPSPLEAIWVNVRVPIQMQSGHFLVYFLDVIRTPNFDGGMPLRLPVIPEVISAEGQLRGFCHTPEWAINPLHLNAVDRDRQSSSSRGSSVSRQRREAVGPEVKVERQAPPTQSTAQLEDDSSLQSTHSSDTEENRSRQQKTIECDRPLENHGVPLCLDIPCRIDKLGRGDAVRIVVRGWLWADTLFRYKFSDVAVVTKASVEIPSTAFGIPVAGNFTITPLSISQNFVFEGIKILITQTIPIIPVIVGVVLGLVLLIIIIIIMWKCGFFKRARLEDSASEQTGGDMSQKQAQI